MKICYYGKLWIPIMEELENRGYIILYEQFSKDADVVLLGTRGSMYDIYPILKKIKKNNIKFVNVLIDIPPWYLTIKENQKYIGYIKQQFLQYLYHIIHKHRFLDKIIINIFKILNKHKTPQKLYNFIRFFLNTNYQNKIYWQVHYKRFLKNSDLDICVSKFSQYCYKKFLNIDSKLWYPAVNSKVIKEIKEKLPIKYDMINISRIVAHKRQKLIVDASKKLNLKLIIIGKHQDKNIKLDCPHFYIPKYFDVMKKLKQSHLYIVPSVFEGFGMTPIEAAFLDKIIIASDIYIHREILGNYPIYFIKDNLNDLMKKIKYALDGKFQIDKEALNQIKKKYSVESAANRLEKFLIKL